MDIKKYKTKTFLKKIVSVLVGLFLLILILQYGSHVSKKIYTYGIEVFTRDKVISIGDTLVRVEVADTPNKRTEGLSGRKDLSEKQGMLFVFEAPDLYGIWMKDMNFDIDILWINENKEIIYIVEQAKPESYPETFLPPTPSTYIIEVPALFVQKNNIKIGDRIAF